MHKEHVALINLQQSFFHVANLLLRFKTFWENAENNTYRINPTYAYLKIYVNFRQKIMIQNPEYTSIVVFRHKNICEYEIMWIAIGTQFPQFIICGNKSFYF